MATEIERKFLVTNHNWKKHVTQSIQIRQGYFCNNDAVSIRVRVTGKTASLNFKSVNIGIQRSEYDYEIPVSDAWEMLESLCKKPIIEKTRYLVPDDGNTWEIDVFGAKNTGLIIAEIELENINQQVNLPEWVGKEVTDEKRYYNPWLCAHPYQLWTD
ncbi:MAG TPA: CYTH domain-containing protein [Crenotrichaceae bacterium]|nr:CYTH domain-containing protein [Crenotrichaceae bacterium]